MISTPTGLECPACGAHVADGLLACPGCRRLTHADRLKRLVDDARTAAKAGNRDAELAAWTAAVELLPADSAQHTSVTRQIASLARDQGASVPPPQPHSQFWKRIVALGPVGFLAWKLKFIAVALLANGKLLLLGLAKTTTFLSMLLAFGVYWTAWGLWFALGLVLSIYIHEMGHVAALHRYGIAATAPMFVPGLGAFIRVQQRALPPLENARVGLAGPVWGLGAALAALVVARAGGGPMWSAIARTGAWINLFNLLPVWQLDGNRGFSALGRGARLLVSAAFGAAWFLTADGLCILLGIASALRAFGPDVPDESDFGVWTQFVVMTVALAGVLRATAGCC